jgi:ketosteroid isomerase-like protein
MSHAHLATGTSRHDLTRSHEHAHIVRELYDAFTAGDLDWAAQFIAPDCVVHVPGRGVNAGDYWGVDGFRQFMSNIARHGGGVFDMEVPAFAVNEEHAFTREIIRMNRAHDPDNVFTLRISNWLVLRGDKLVESWVVPEDQRAYDAFWTRPVDSRPTSIRARGHRTSRRRELLNVASAVSAENRQLLEAMYDRFWSGDLNGMRALIADDVLVNIAGRSAISGVYHGWGGYMQFRERLMATAGSRYKLEVAALAASDRDGFAVERIRMNRRWDPAVQEIFVLMHFSIEGGRIVIMDDFPLDTEAWERFYSPPGAME